MVKWAIYGETFDPNRISFEIERGSIEVWEIMNEMMGMPHPMHIHGFQFQVLYRQGSPQQPAELAVDGGRLPTNSDGKIRSSSGPARRSASPSTFQFPMPGHSNTSSTVTTWNMRIEHDGEL